MLHADASADVRKLVVGVVELEQGRRGAAAGAAAGADSRHARREQRLVVKRAMLSATNLLRPALALLAAQAAPPSRAARGARGPRSASCAPCSRLLGARGQGAGDSVRTHALKFAETLVLAFTPGPADAGEPWSVALLADDAHPLLKCAELAAAAEETLQLLLGRLRGALTATLALVLVAERSPSRSAASGRPRSRGSRRRCATSSGASRPARSRASSASNWRRSSRRCGRPC